MTFLQLEILELFAEAQYLGKDRRQHLHAWAARVTEMVSKRDKAHGQVVAIGREQICRDGYRFIQTLPEKTEVCACGGILEYRIGVKQPIHLGRCQI